MAGGDDLHTGGGSRPVPDPTVLTTQQLDRETAALRTELTIRINGIEKAQEKFEANLLRVPTDVDRAVSQLREMTEVRFKAADDAVRNALAAAKEVIAVERQSSAEAIDKAERATTKLLENTEAMSRSSVAGLEGKIGDLKDRLNLIEGRQAGATQQRENTQGSIGMWIGILGVSILVGSTIVGVTIAVTSGGNTSPRVEGLSIESSRGGVPEVKTQISNP